MKIICKDNFGRDTHSESLVAGNVSEYYAKAIAEFLNQRYGGDNSQDFFKVVPDDYKLYKFEP